MAPDNERMHATALRDPDGNTDNLGPIEAAVRGALALGALVLTATGLSRLSIDWAAVVLIHGFVLTAYLALSALARIDPLYAMAGIDRTRAGRRRRVETRTRPGAPRRPGRPI